jgi:DNA polymerase III subunit beta
MGAKKIKTAPATVNAAPVTDAVGGLRKGIEIVLHRRTAKALVAKFASIVDRKSTMTILGNVSLRADREGLTITGTDLDVSLRQTFPCVVTGNGCLSVPQKRLADVIKAMPDGDLTIRQSDKSITVSCGAANATIEGMSDSDTPKFPAFTDEALWSKIPTEALADVLENVRHAICDDQTRFHLNSVRFEILGNTIRGVATDGHRLAKCERPWENDQDLRVPPTLIPRKGVREFGKLVDTKQPVSIAFTKRHVWFRQGDMVLVAKTIDAVFPPYEQVIPTANKRLVTVDSKALGEALGRAVAYTSQTRGAILSLASGKLVVTTDDSSESIEASYSCETFKCGVNPKFLAETLAQIDGSIVISVGEPCAYDARGKTKEAAIQILDPIMVRSLDDAAMRPILEASFVGVVMPMRI